MDLLQRSKKADVFCIEFLDFWRSTIINAGFV
jgi:hypothetical protein